MKNKNIKIIISILLLSMILFNNCNCKAYNINDGTITFNFTQLSDWWGEDSGSGSIAWSPENNNDRCIVFINEELSQKCHDYYSNVSNTYSDFYFVISKGERKLMVELFKL